MSIKNIGKKRGFPGSVRHSAESVQPVKQFRYDDLDDSKFLEQNEIQMLFRVIKSKRDRAIFRLVYHRGLRAHEPGLLELSDFRERGGVLFVKRGKGSISRDYSLCDEELRVLKAYIRDERGSAPGPLFPSRQGRKGISRKMLHVLMKRYCKLAGIPPEKSHMHALKHSCGTHLAERGSQSDEIQDWMGHVESRSTDIYMHFTERRRRGSHEKHRDWR